MKYAIILLILASFFLTGCFEKKSAPLENEVIIEQTTENNNTQVEDIIDQNTENDTLFDEKKEDDFSPSTDTGSSSLSASGTTQAEAEVISEYETDLEELFNDILGEE